MKNSFLTPIAVVCCLLFINTASAQTTVNHTSPVADYQLFVDEKISSWKAANDKVRQIGGWRAYAKEAQAVAIPESPTLSLQADLLDTEKIAKAPLQARLSWLQAIAKQEQLVYAQQMHASAQASSELARRMRSVGNMTRLQQAGQHAIYAETAALLITSSQEAYEAREALIRALGFNDAKAEALVLPEKLPALPSVPIAEGVLTRVVRTTSSQWFAHEASSELRSSYTAYRNAYDLAKHYRDEVLPLRKIISEEATLRYNGMFIGVFELLSEHREQIKTASAAINATLAFWQAHAAFQNTLQTQLSAMSEQVFVE